MQFFTMAIIYYYMASTIIYATGVFGVLDNESTNSRIHDLKIEGEAYISSNMEIMNYMFDKREELTNVLVKFEDGINRLQGLSNVFPDSVTNIRDISNKLLGKYESIVKSSKDLIDTCKKYSAQGTEAILAVNECMNELSGKITEINHDRIVKNCDLSFLLADKFEMNVKTSGEFKNIETYITELQEGTVKINSEINRVKYEHNSKDYVSEKLSLGSTHSALNPRDFKYQFNIISKFGDYSSTEILDVLRLNLNALRHFTIELSDDIKKKLTNSYAILVSVKENIQRFLNFDKSLTEKQIKIDRDYSVDTVKKLLIEAQDEFTRIKEPNNKILKELENVVDMIGKLINGGLNPDVDLDRYNKLANKVMGLNQEYIVNKGIEVFDEHAKTTLRNINIGHHNLVEDYKHYVDPTYVKIHHGFQDLKSGTNAPSNESMGSHASVNGDSNRKQHADGEDALESLSRRSSTSNSDSTLSKSSESLSSGASAASKIISAVLSPFRTNKRSNNQDDIELSTEFGAILPEDSQHSSGETILDDAQPSGNNDLVVAEVTGPSDNLNIGDSSDTKSLNKVSSESIETHSHHESDEDDETLSFPSAMTDDTVKTLMPITTPIDLSVSPGILPPNNEFEPRTKFEPELSRLNLELPPKDDTTTYAQGPESLGSTKSGDNLDLDTPEEDTSLDQFFSLQSHAGDSIDGGNGHVTVQNHGETSRNEGESTATKQSNDEDHSGSEHVLHLSGHQDTHHLTPVTVTAATTDKSGIKGEDEKNLSSIHADPISLHSVQDFEVDLQNHPHNVGSSTSVTEEQPVTTSSISETNAGSDEMLKDIHDIKNKLTDERPKFESVRQFLVDRNDILKRLNNEMRSRLIKADDLIRLNNNEIHEQEARTIFVKLLDLKDKHDSVADSYFNYFRQRIIDVDNCIEDIDVCLVDGRDLNFMQNVYTTCKEIYTSVERALEVTRDGLSNLMRDVSSINEYYDDEIKHLRNLLENGNTSNSTQDSSFSPNTHRPGTSSATTNDHDEPSEVGHLSPSNGDNIAGLDTRVEIPTLSTHDVNFPELQISSRFGHISDDHQVFNDVLSRLPERIDTLLKYTMAMRNNSNIYKESLKNELLMNKNTLESLTNSSDINECRSVYNMSEKITEDTCKLLYEDAKFYASIHDRVSSISIYKDSLFKENLSASHILSAITSIDVELRELEEELGSYQDHVNDAEEALSRLLINSSYISEFSNGNEGSSEIRTDTIRKVLTEREHSPSELIDIGNKVIEDIKKNVDIAVNNRDHVSYKIEHIQKLINKAPAGDNTEKARKELNRILPIGYNIDDRLKSFILLLNHNYDRMEELLTKYSLYLEEKHDEEDKKRVYEHVKNEIIAIEENFREIAKDCPHLFHDSSVTNNAFRNILAEVSELLKDYIVDEYEDPFVVHESLFNKGDFINVGKETLKETNEMAEEFMKLKETLDNEIQVAKNAIETSEDLLKLTHDVEELKKFREFLSNLEIYDESIDSSNHLKRVWDQLRANNIGLVVEINRLEGHTDETEVDYTEFIRAFNIADNYLEQFKDKKVAENVRDVIKKLSGYVESSKKLKEYASEFLPKQEAHENDSSDHIQEKQVDHNLKGIKTVRNYRELVESDGGFIPFIATLPLIIISTAIIHLGITI